MKLQVKKLHPEAKLPSFAHDTDAGMDLYCLEKIALAPLEKLTIRTGIALAIPPGYVGLMWDKSGISHKRGLKTLGGVVDAGYRGEVFVGLVNVGQEVQTFEAGDKVTQLLIQKVEHPEIVEVNNLEETPRGTGGFGSTGVK